MRFFKYHALGNDYLVLEPRDCPEMFAAKAIRAICHRNYGLGSDGILYGPIEAEGGADFGLQIWNPDGSQAEKSGNGLRIFSRHLQATGRVEADKFTVSTPGGIVGCEVLENGEIRVEMGKVSFDAADIPVRGEVGEVIDRTIEVDGHPLTYCAATIGNPHVVVPMQVISPELVKRYGPLIENAIGHFPNRTNVQLLRAINEDTIQIEIWERGAGYTLASGSSSSAAAAVAHRLGLCSSEVTVCCPGGNIDIQIGDDYAITMTGPATTVGIFEMDPIVPLQRIPKGA